MAVLTTFEVEVDNDSVSSGDDEMWNVEVPFSQNSHTLGKGSERVSPMKSSAETSTADSDQEAAGREKWDQRESKAVSGKKRKPNSEGSDIGINDTEVEQKGKALNSRILPLLFILILKSLNLIFYCKYYCSRPLALRMANMPLLDGKIGTSDKLFWHEQKKKKKDMIFPCRICPREETIVLA